VLHSWDGGVCGVAGIAVSETRVVGLAALPVVLGRPENSQPKKLLILFAVIRTVICFLNCNCSFIKIMKVRINI